jgi:hypothetical protein
MKVILTAVALLLSTMAAQRPECVSDLSAGSAPYRKPRKNKSSRSIASLIASACWLFSAMTCGALSACAQGTIGL